MAAHVFKTALAPATPSLNRGVGFTHEERRRPGLAGRLPSGVLTPDQQAARVASITKHTNRSGLQYAARSAALPSRGLHFKPLSGHLTELIPVVYTLGHGSCDGAARQPRWCPCP
jgi:malate dehydrogenase (oxaloacetate-decarboxylating)